jgi:phosphinothricin acetyltransferase
MQIRNADAADAVGITEIYNYYIENSHATFETARVNVSEMKGRIEETLSAGYPFIVCLIDENIVGYSYGRRYRPRDAYRQSVEISVYVRRGFEGRSVGKRLYAELLPKLSEFHAVIAGISLPNEPSIKLHERSGFQKVAHFKEVGYKFGRWIDVAYWQRINRPRTKSRTDLES